MYAQDGTVMGLWVGIYIAIGKRECIHRSYISKHRWL